jgi:hypothetical protein
MIGSKRKSTRQGQGACFVLLCLAVVVSMFFFLTVIAHTMLEDSGHTAEKAPITNKLAKWVEDGEKEIADMEKLVLAAGRKEIAALGEDIRFVVEPYIPHGTGSGPQGQGALGQAQGQTQGQAQGQTQGQGQALSAQQLAHLSDPTYSSVLHGTQDPLARAPYHALTCPHGDLLSFWSKTTEADRLYVTPYLAQPSPASGSCGSFFSSASLRAHTSTDTSTPLIPAPTKYVTFEPDPGGW